MTRHRATTPLGDASPVASLVASGAPSQPCSHLTPPSNLRRHGTHPAAGQTSAPGPLPEVPVPTRSSALVGGGAALPRAVRSSKRRPGLAQRRWVRYGLAAVYVAAPLYFLGAIGYVLIWVIAR